ncbi:RNA polymerase sigma-B factor [Asanoa hainanensis]|uniref:RNA polymerase sigma-B factor n=2 Tax=Asanoa hainanensis TaxID=560556 RepID=A0A239PEU2_9ACTN|nr:RNA polymerase sigma-B factor [Asanoa hainanensis]
MAAPETTPRARDAARDQVIGLYLPLAHRLARRYHGGGEPMDDLVQVAAIGLIRAVDRFDARKGETFAAYAIPTIVGELRRHFRDRAYDVRIPRRLQEHAMRVRSAAGDLAQRLRRTPGVADLARHLGLSEDEVIEAMAVGDVRTALSIDSLNGPIPPSGTPRERVGAVDPELENVESRTMVRSLLAELPARERRIVWLRFFEERTQSAIADEVGLSQMHVSRLLSRALETMRRGAAS